MEKEIKKGNPDYSEERVDKTIGDIWYNKVKPSTKKKIKNKYE